MKQTEVWGYVKGLVWISDYETLCGIQTLVICRCSGVRLFWVLFPFRLKLCAEAIISCDLHDGQTSITSVFVDQVSPLKRAFNHISPTGGIRWRGRMRAAQNEIFHSDIIIVLLSPWRSTHSDKSDSCLLKRQSDATNAHFIWRDSWFEYLCVSHCMFSACKSLLRIVLNYTAADKTICSFKKLKKRKKTDGREEEERSTVDFEEQLEDSVNPLGRFERRGGRIQADLKPRSSSSLPLSFFSEQRDTLSPWCRSLLSERYYWGSLHAPK